MPQARVEHVRRRYRALRTGLALVRLLGIAGALLVLGAGVVGAEALAILPLLPFNLVFLTILFSGAVVAALLVLTVSLALPDLAQVLIDTEANTRRIAAALEDRAATPRSAAPPERRIE
ncbi:MAG: hypothetical protein ABI629_24785 [bacterium]